MPITTISARSFNHDTSKARKAASSGPVFITERGQPAHVLLSIADFERLSGQSANIIDLLAMPSGGDIDLDITPSRDLAAPAEFL